MPLSVEEAHSAEEPHAADEAHSCEDSETHSVEEILAALATMPTPRSETMLDEFSTTTLDRPPRTYTPYKEVTVLDLLPRAEQASRKAKRRNQAPVPIGEFCLEGFLQHRGLVQKLHEHVWRSVYGTEPVKGAEVEAEESQPEESQETVADAESKTAESKTASTSRRNFSGLEGNCLCTLHLENRLFYLQGGQKTAVRRNLFALAVCPVWRISSMLEVGFNAGHSASIVCYAWEYRAAYFPDAAGTLHRYAGFDLCEHGYTRPCFDVLQDEYSGGNAGELWVDFRLVPGDSRETLKTMSTQIFEKYDLIHVDGGHSAAICREDIVNARKFAIREEEVVTLSPRKEAVLSAEILKERERENAENMRKMPRKPSLLLVDDAHFMGIAEVLIELTESGLIREATPEEFGGQFERIRMHGLFVYL